MIIVGYMGGLGNQMFIYAMQIVIGKKFPNQEIKADIHHYNLLNEHNGFEIPNYFDVELNYAAIQESGKLFDGLLVPGYFSAIKIPEKLRWIIAARFQSYYMRVKRKITGNRATVYDLPNMGYNPQINELEHGNWFLWGLWQNTKYFENYKEEIQKSFKFKTDWIKDRMNHKDITAMEKLMNGSMIAVHVRGGDFKQPKYQICGPDYYAEAYSEFQDGAGLCVFTDDEEYARSILPADRAECMISHPVDESIIDMYMLSRAKKLILSNSTFSFWGGFLNVILDNKVAAPCCLYYENGKCIEFPKVSGWKYINNRDFYKGEKERKNPAKFIKKKDMGDENEK